MGTNAIRTTAPRRPSAWTRLGWPVLAGFVGAVGVAGAAAPLGIPRLLGAFAVLMLLSLATVWAVAQAFEVQPHIVRLGVEGALVFLVLVGWSHLTSYGPLVVLATGLTAPTVLEALARRRHPRRAPARGDLDHVLLDREMLARRFEEIVQQLEDAGDSRDE